MQERLLGLSSFYATFLINPLKVKRLRRKTCLLSARMPTFLYACEMLHITVQMRGGLVESNLPTLVINFELTTANPL